MRKSFTLIELIVTIAIVAVLAAIVIPNALTAIEKAKIARMINDYKSIKTAAFNYHSDTGAWPGSCSVGCKISGFIADNGDAGWTDRI